MPCNSLLVNFSHLKIIDTKINTQATIVTEKLTYDDACKKLSRIIIQHALHGKLALSLIVSHYLIHKHSSSHITCSSSFFMFIHNRNMIHFPISFKFVN